MDPNLARSLRWSREPSRPESTRHPLGATEADRIRLARLAAARRRAALRRAHHHRSPVGRAQG